MFDDTQTTQKPDDSTDDSTQNNDQGSAPQNFGLGGYSSSGQIDQPTASEPNIDAVPTLPPTEAEAPEAPNEDNIAPVDNFAPAAQAADVSTSANGDTNLDDLKRRALDQLSPLVSKLDQPPEEKYKTLMMMIQASDNQALLNEAYETAQKIQDEKTKAEALLTIVNEINYFSQKG